MYSDGRPALLSVCGSAITLASLKHNIVIISKCLCLLIIEMQLLFRELIFLYCHFSHEVCDRVDGMLWFSMLKYRYLLIIENDKMMRYVQNCLKGPFYDHFQVHISM